MSVGFREFDVEKKRERLRKLSDKELAREVLAARFLMPPRIKLTEVALIMRTRGETRTSRCVSLLLHREANRLDVDRISLLNGNVVAAGSHMRDLHDDLFLVLF